MPLFCAYQVIKNGLLIKYKYITFFTFKKGYFILKLYTLLIFLKEKRYDVRFQYNKQ